MRLKKEYLNKKFMNFIKAKNTIEILSRQWKISNSVAFVKIIEGLWIPRELIAKNISQDFEFSFIEGENKIRLNHLLFLDMREVDGTGKEKMEDRINRISLVAEEIEKRFNVKFDKSIFKKILLFAKKNKKFPLQFGLEYDLELKPKMKIYLSVNAKNFPLKTFCHLIKFNSKIINDIFLGNKFDTVAIDFLPNGTSLLKLYPLVSENSGLTVRFYDGKKIISKKIWHRIPGGLGMEDFKKSKFLSTPIFLEKYIIKNKIKIAYLCNEKNKKSFYFR